MIPPRSELSHFTLVPYPTFRHSLQMLPVRALAVCLGALHQFLFIDKTIDVGNLFRRRNHNALSALNRLHKVRRLEQAAHRPGIQPCKAAAKQLDIQKAVIQVHLIQRRDFKLPPSARLHPIRP